VSRLNEKKGTKQNRSEQSFHFVALSSCWNEQGIFQNHWHDNWQSRINGAKFYHC
jgi:hypothetical protein